MKLKNKTVLCFIASLSAGGDKSASNGNVVWNIESPAEEGDTYNGLLTQELTHPSMGLVGTSETEDYTVKVTPGENEGEVNITFSGFTFPEMPFAFEDFTITATATENADGTITYSAEPTTIITTGGGIPSPYNVTFEGESASADATPVFHLVMRNATTDDVWFGADKDAIDAYKEKLTTIDVDGTRVPIAGNVDVAVEVIEKTPYSGDTAEFNVDDVLAFFAEGTTMADVTTYWLNPDNTTVAAVYGGGTIDGWRNADGYAAQWGESQNGLCVKLSNPASGVFDYIGAHDGNFLAGDSYVARFAFVKDNQSVILALTVNFVAAPVVEAEIVKTIEINHNELEKTAYSESTETVDVAAVCEALGITDITEAEYKAAIPDGEGGYTFETVTTDGWRSATDGSQLGWGNEGGICVKVWNQETGATDGNITYIGCYDDTHVAGETYTFYYAIIANGKAVLYQINFNFVMADGINGIAADAASLEDALAGGRVFDLSGRQIRTITNNGIYIVNGKKMAIKK